MKKSLLILFTLTCFLQKVSANHITGGEVYYTYLGKIGTNYSYHVVLKLYRNEASSVQLDVNAAIAIFNKTTGAMFSNTVVDLAQKITLTLTTPSPCISNPPEVSYEVGYYEYDIILPSSPD